MLTPQLLIALIVLVTFFRGGYALAMPPIAELVAIHPDKVCQSSDCSGHDAIVFVHGIYGSRETFRNADTQFDWPSEFPTVINGRLVDVFVLDYMTRLVAWAQGSQPDFNQIDAAVFNAMAPLRRKQYRSIGIIAHSLGGNVASSYIHAVKSSLNHPARSQHAFVITLGTPVIGSQIADLGSLFKSILGMSDPLLNSLKIRNDFLKMLQAYRVREGPKGEKYRCRQVNLHAGYEENRMLSFRVVSQESAVQEIRSIAVPPIRGFARDHSSLVKPRDSNDEVYRWVLQIVQSEFLRLAIWEEAHQNVHPDYRRCELIPFMPEP